MRVAVFGGSGATGQMVIAEAVARGWDITGLVRRSGTLDPGGVGAAEVVGEFAAEEPVARTVARANAVVIVVGPRSPYRDVFCADATRAVIDAARAAGSRRLVCQTGALIGSYPANRGPVFRLLGKMLARWMKASSEDRRAQEEVVRRSGLPWTLVKPPRLTNGPRTGSVAIGEDVKAGLFSSVSRRDLADVLLDLCVDDSTVGKTLFVKAR